MFEATSISKEVEIASPPVGFTGQLLCFQSRAIGNSKVWNSHPKNYGPGSHTLILRTGGFWFNPPDHDLSSLLFLFIFICYIPVFLFLGLCFLWGFMFNWTDRWTKVLRSPLNTPFWHSPKKYQRIIIEWPWHNIDNNRTI